MPVIDLHFPAHGTFVPADHGYVLFSAICQVVPAIHANAGLGIHPIRGRLDGDRRLALDRRSAVTLRCDSNRIAEILPLAGQSLRLSMHRLRLGVPHIRVLEPVSRLQARLVVIKKFLEPVGFLEAARRQLSAAGIEADLGFVIRRLDRSSVDGGTGSTTPWVRRTLNIKGKEIVGFALQASGLSPAHSLELQVSGLGGRRRFGCGLFTHGSPTEGS